MKYLLLIILLMATTVVLGQTYTNGVFVKQGRTVEVDKKIHVVTNDTAYFSNELVAKIDVNTEMTVNSFFQEVFQTRTPTKVKFGSHSMAATIMNGSATLVYSGGEANSSCVISTALTDLELSNGTFYLRVSENKILVVAIDGSLKAHSGKKEFKVEKGYALIATPNDLGILEDKISLSVEKVRVETLAKLGDDAKKTEQIKGSLLWAFVDGKVIGIVLN